MSRLIASKNHPMRKFFLLLTSCSGFLFSQAIPVNDDCSNAILLSVNEGSSCTYIYTADITDATQSLAPCVPMSYEAKDVWFKFIATGETHTLTVTPEVYTDFIIQVYSGSCNSLSSFACIDNSRVNETEGATLTNLTAGNTYYVRVFSKYGWASYRFKLCINSSNSVVPNDEPAGAIQRPPTGPTSIATYSNLGATLSLPACTGSAAKDIWFKFTATGTRHVIWYSIGSHQSYQGAVEVFSGSPGNLTSIKCFGLPGERVEVGGLTIGETYYYRIYISNGSSISANLSTFVYPHSVSPVNDECSGAITLNVNEGSNCTNVYSADVKDLTQSLAPCIAMGYYEANDVWYKFTATGATHTLTLTPEVYTDFAIQVYSGSCNSLSSIACIDNSSVNEVEGATLTNLVPGDTYFIRIFSKYGWTEFKFKLCISSSESAIPNDEPAGAIERPTTGPTSIATYSNLGATLSLPACTGTAAKDIWFKFIATGTRHVIWYSIGSHESYPGAVEIFSGAPGNLISIKCHGLPGDRVDVAGLTIGQTYYYRIYISTGNAISSNISTFVYPPSNASANDECNGAITLNVNSDNTCSSENPGDVKDLTQSLTPCIAMGTYLANDAWYKFIATGTTHTLTLTPEVFTDFVMQVYSGSCNNLTSIACIDSSILNETEGATLTNLVAGNTYFIRVFSKYGWTEFKFRLCISSAGSVIPNDEPAGAIERPTTGPSSNKSFTLLGATPSLPACTGTATKDIWFKFVATSTRHVIRYSSAGFNDYPTAVEVFSGIPGNLSSIKCYGLADNYADVAGFTVGQTYYYRLYISNGDAASTHLSTFVSTPVALPLNFVSFSVQRQDNSNMLKWETSDESNVSGFEVQVSNDGNLFETISFIPYTESGRTANSYSYRHTLDTFNGDGVIYYRIKEIDKDNSFLYSKIVSIRLEPTHGISIFPNPVKHTIKIRTNSGNDFDFEIVDLSGKTILKGRTFNHTIDVKNLKTGVFIIKLQSGTLMRKTFLVMRSDG